MAIENKKIKGIGGWLILPTIALVGTMLISLLNLFFFINGFLYDPKPLELNILVYVLISTILLLLSSYVLYLEFKKQKKFINWIIAYFIIGFISSFILSVMDNDYSSIFWSLFWVVVWVLYINKSVRVKNTFVK